MPGAYTTFASSRFVDAESIVAALRECAARLRAQQEEVEAVYLFGSFAAGTATPRSDADIAVVVTEADMALRQRLWEAAWAIFLDAPVPVDLFVIPVAQLIHQGYALRGIAGAVAREGLRLG